VGPLFLITKSIYVGPFPSYILYLVLRVTFYVGPFSILYTLFSLTCDLLRGPFLPQMDHLLLLPGWKKPGFFKNKKKQPTWVLLFLFWILLGFY